MCSIDVQIISNTKQSGVVSLKILQNGNLHIKIKVRAPPERGKANKEMIKLLSEVLSVRKSSIKLISGQSTSSKKVYIDKEQKDLMELLKNNKLITI